MEHIESYLSTVIIVIVVGAINFIISRILIRKNKYFVFILPGIFMIASLVFIFMGLSSSQSGSWAALGLLILAGITAVMFISTIITSLIVFFKSKDNT